MRLIDADELLEVLARNCVFFGDNNEELSWDIIEDSINEGTTIEAEPIRHAHWNMKPSGYGVCSNCGKGELDVGAVWSNYCPYCGAAMDEAI